MPAESAMARIRIAVEADVLGEEVPKGLQQRTVPTRSRQECSKDGFKPAVLVTCQSQCPDVWIHGASLGQVALTDCDELTLSVLRSLDQLQRSPHELVVVHLLAGRRNAWPR